MKAEADDVESTAAEASSCSDEPRAGPRGAAVLRAHAAAAALGFLVVTGVELLRGFRILVAAVSGMAVVASGFCGRGRCVGIAVVGSFPGAGVVAAVVVPCFRRGPHGHGAGGVGRRSLRRGRCGLAAGRRGAAQFAEPGLDFAFLARRLRGRRRAVAARGAGGWPRRRCSPRCARHSWPSTSAWSAARRSGLRRRWGSASCPRPTARSPARAWRCASSRRAVTRPRRPDASGHAAAGAAVRPVRPRRPAPRPGSRTVGRLRSSGSSVSPRPRRS